MNKLQALDNELNRLKEIIVCKIHSRENGYNEEQFYKIANEKLMELVSELKEPSEEKNEVAF